MRLIDADKLIAKIQSMPDACRLFMYRKGEKIKAGLTSIINRQSTTYDVDRVVEQLEKMYSEIPFQYENNYEDGLSDGLLKAIKIVKSGGIGKEKEETE